MADNLNTPGGHDVQDSFDMDNMDMDDMFDDDMLGGIPAKHSDSEDDGGNRREIEMQDMNPGLDVLNSLSYGDGMDSDPESPNGSPMMGQIELSDINQLGMEEEKDGYDSGMDSRNDEESQSNANSDSAEMQNQFDLQDPKVMNQLDAMVKMMLIPDFFNTKKKRREALLEKQIQGNEDGKNLREVLTQMTKKQRRRELVLVSDRISGIDKVEMYDKQWFKELGKPQNQALPKKEQDAIRDDYKFEKVDREKWGDKEEGLPELKKKVPHFFEDEDDEDSKKHDPAISDGSTQGDGSEVPNGDGEEYLQTRNKRTNTFGDLAGGVGAIGGAGLGAMSGGLGAVGKGLGGGLGAGLNVLGLAADEGPKVVCSACGNRMKFKKKNAKKYNYMGYKCTYVDNHGDEQVQELIFHDYLCVKLRKIKEAIKEYVFIQEKEANKDIELENALINIEETGTTDGNPKMRPKKKTTPKKGDFDYDPPRGRDREDSADSSQYSSGMDDSGLDDFDDIAGYDLEDEHSTMSRTQSMTSRRYAKHEKEKLMKQFGYQIAPGLLNQLQDVPKDIAFRRYRIHVRRMVERLEPSKKDQHRKPGGMSTYNERFEKLPKILLYCDLNEFGEAVFLFISDSMKSKTRQPLWNILQWLALEMPTTKVLELLESEKHLLNSHDLPNYDKMCKATMEGAKFPIAATLKLAAFMLQQAKEDLSNKKIFTEKSEQYVYVARRLLKEIESDHLFGMRLMLPTDIDQKNVIEIALEYELVHFLEDPRIVKVFSVIWFHGYDFLDPSKPIFEPDITFTSIFDKVKKTPGRFYWSPVGQFMITTVLYLLFLTLFCYVTMQQYYDFMDTPLDNPDEAVLWVFAGGYTAYEFVEFLGDPGEYFGQMSNLFDVGISLSWIALAILRLYGAYVAEQITDESGNVDYAAERQETMTVVFMSLWALQCILMWLRVINIFQIHPQTGPLIKMIIKMVDDVKNWGIVTALFLAGGIFATYYVAAQDADPDQLAGGGQFSAVFFYMLQTLLGQQEWDAVTSYDDPVTGEVSLDSLRSSILQCLIVLYSIVGNIMLLNLLIAMMAATFEKVQERSTQELNFAKVRTYYDLDTSACGIAPPFNVIAYVVLVYVFGSEMIAWLCTFGHRQWNEEYLSPLNKGKFQYQPGDKVTFRMGGKKLKGICVSRTPKANRPVVTKRKSKDEKGGALEAISRTQTDAVIHHDLEVQHRDTVYPIKEDDIVKVKKQLFKRRTHRLPSLDSEKMFCKFCRYDLTNDRMPIEQYLALFEKYGQHIDPADAAHMRQLVATVDDCGIPAPLLCSLCPNCYRPFKEDPNKGPDVLDRAQYMLEIVSFGVFKYLLVRHIFLFLCFLPKFLTDVVRPVIETLVLKAASLVLGDLDTKSKSIMNTSEDNDDFRLKVRQVSQSEEKQETIVRRIDTSVTRLKRTLMGDWMKQEGDELLEEERQKKRKDAFEDQIEKMEAELHRKFAAIEQLLGGVPEEDANSKKKKKKNGQ